MEQKHWTDDDLLARLYDVDHDKGHLENCVLCMRRWNEYRRRREQFRITEPEVPQEFLVAQRRAIEARLEQRPHLFYARLAPALAAVLLMLVVLTVSRTPPPQPVTATVSDDKSFEFEEVFTLVASPEPLAVEPVRSLFEVQ